MRFLFATSRRIGGKRGSFFAKTLISTRIRKRDEITADKLGIYVVKNARRNYGKNYIVKRGRNLADRRSVRVL